MKLTVHIGTTKTGSTSIQDFLRHNRAAFAQKEICIPEVLGVQDHRKATISALNFGQSQALMQALGIRDQHDHARFVAETHAAYRETIETTLPREVVITSEHLQSRCNLEANVTRFRELFAEGFAQVRILVYVRPQLDQLVSLYSTLLRHGFSDTMEEHIQRLTKGFFKYFDLQGLISRWGNVFGIENIEVRPYKALPSRQEGGVIADFCRFLGQDHADPLFSHPKELNSSINIQGQELLRLANVNGELDPAQRRQEIARIEANFSGQGAEPNLAQARTFQSRFDKGNAWVIETFFPDHPEYLEPRWPKA
ncbi:hypothetical protein SAMN04488021_10264 [Paracoccus aminovorans]|uniref:Sulfotransferase family protein n=1 Tax=Paracoccus aminovorans TaxID=34004 RepID=A0A1I2XRS1_9RHOB|nr:hypothetical protein [Paracoccus aminovorans]CQR87274.1 hypothetical protein JCM7685_2730 [Paracoccus aminovorans]SFH16208.1 hypothetical protein SAMN04488021_10264 [Paracoccus aminovorans]